MRTLTPFQRAKDYLVKQPPAIQGQGGDVQTYKVACALVRFGCNRAEAFELLSDYSATCCNPPWTHRELEHKVERAFKDTQPQSFNRSWFKERTLGTLRTPTKPAPVQPVEIPNPENLPVSDYSGAKVLSELFRSGELIRVCPDACRHFQSTYLKRDELLEQIESGKLRTAPAGALIGLNPRKEKNGKDDDCAEFRHLLLECDKVSLEQQWAILKATNLPISAVIFSGNQSLHAWVRLDAKDKAEFDQRARFVFSHPLLTEFDSATKNAGRLGRFPAVIREGREQRVIAMRMGAESFDVWERDNLRSPDDSLTEQAQERWGFECLGYNQNTFYFLPRDTGQVAEITSDKLCNRDALSKIEPDARWWAHTFPNDKGGTDYNLAGLELRSRCISAGVWTDKEAGRRLKGRGVWLDSGSIVVNDGTGLIVNGERGDCGECGEHKATSSTTSTTLSFQSPSGFIYVRGEKLPVAIENPLSDSEASNYAQLMELQAQNKSAGQVLSGFTVNGFLLGVIPFRPSVWIAGSAEVGKTHTRRLIAKALGSFSVDVSANTTEAHLRQSLSGALPVLFDEAESDDKAGQEAMARILALCRAGAELDGQTIGKGGQSGNAVGFHIRTCGLFSSIHTQLERSRDASRFVVIELKELSEAEKTQRNTEARRLQKLTVDTPAFSARLAGRAVRYAPYLLENTQKLEEAFLRLTNSDREAKKWTALVCGSVCLLPETEWALSDTRAQQIAEAFDIKRFGKVEKDSQSALIRLLSHKLDSKEELSRTVGDLLYRVRENLDTPKGSALESDILASMGLKLTQECLVVQYAHSAVTELFKVEPWNGKARRVRDELKQIKGAELRNQMRVGATRFPSVLIPISALDDLLEERGTPY